MSSSNPAETYESYMVPPLFEPSAQRLLDIADPRPGERVLDVATGTGIVARCAASRVGVHGKVVGLDLSAGMLAVARARAEREEVMIEWQEGRAEAQPFPDGGFDLVLCQFGLMFFADRHAAVMEMHRVLAGGGRVALSVFQGLERHPFYQALDAAIERRLGMSPVTDIFGHGDPNGLRALLAHAGFQEMQFHSATVTARFPNPEGFLAGEIDVDTASIPAIQHLDASARQALTAAIRADMDVALREVTEGDFVVIPFHLQMVHAQR